MYIGDRVDKIISFEGGEMNEREEVEFIAELIRDGSAWQLQGFYGRTASAYIRAGIISETGEVLQ